LSKEIKIINIHNDPAGKDTKEKLNDEYVTIKNTGTESINITGWQLTDWRPNQKHIHVYIFPEYLNENTTWTLDPGELAFIMTGSGADTFVKGSSNNLPQFHFHWNKDWFVWNNTGDTACLYDVNGILLCQLTVP